VDVASSDERVLLTMQLEELDNRSNVELQSAGEN